MHDCDEDMRMTEADFIASLVWPQYLATNLSWGAALRLSFSLGMQYEAWLDGGRRRDGAYPMGDWRPGCGRSVRP